MKQFAKIIRKIMQEGAEQFLFFEFSPHNQYETAYLRLTIRFVVLKVDQLQEASARIRREYSLPSLTSTSLGDLRLQEVLLGKKDSRPIARE